MYFLTTRIEPSAHGGHPPEQIVKPELSIELRDSLFNIRNVTYLMLKGLFRKELG